ncbi:MAG: hypothetical protein KatS3mg112_0248 [Thermogutta sp.]|nr:MAG: hypothetical protein KatS3mg112_0248 [Thermogutta sp.]
MMNNHIQLCASGVDRSVSHSAGTGSEKRGRLAALSGKSWLFTSVCGLLALLGMGLSIQAGCVILGVYPSGKPVLVKHVGWPLLVTLFGLAGMLATWQRPSWNWVRKWQTVMRRALGFWKVQPWWGRVLIIVGIGHGLISVGYLLNCPEDLLRQYQEIQEFASAPSRLFAGQRVANLEYHILQYRRMIPPRAQVAYRGHWEAMIVAYRLYPRRLVLLPEDVQRLARAWGDHRWLEIKTKGASRADAWTDEYWAARCPPVENPPLSQFLADRHIEYIIVYNENHPELCQVLRVTPETGLARGQISQEGTQR